MFAFGHVFDRDFFLYLLTLEIKRAQRYQNYLSLLSLAFNHHNLSPTGNPDTSLKTMANLIVDDVRETDVVGLGNGNHLLVMMPYANMAALGTVKDRLRQLLHDYGFDKKGIAMEIDEACFPTRATGVDDLLQMAGTNASEELH
jgi:PleD family two-component response regulator